MTQAAVQPQYPFSRERSWTAGVVHFVSAKCRNKRSKYDKNKECVRKWRQDAENALCTDELLSAMFRVELTATSCRLGGVIIRHSHSHHVPMDGFFRIVIS